MQLTKGNDLNNGPGKGRQGKTFALRKVEEGADCRPDAAFRHFATVFTPLALCSDRAVSSFCSAARRSRFVRASCIDSSFPQISGKYENCGTLIAYFSDDSRRPRARARATSDETSQFASKLDTTCARALYDLRVCLLFILYFPWPCVYRV